MCEDNKDDSAEYRNLLIQTWQKSQESYDKAMLTLSAGALGLSFAFIKDIIGPYGIVSKCLLLYAWVCWALSISFTLISFFTSIVTCKRAVTLYDKGERDPKKLGGFSDKITYSLNALSGLLFLVGILLMITFVFKNV